jgi:hypothetical protein
LRDCLDVRSNSAAACFGRIFTREEEHPQASWARHTTGRSILSREWAASSLVGAANANAR